MKIISERTHGETVTYERIYQHADDPSYQRTGRFNSGYGFECNQAGVIAEPTSEAARANLAKCLAGDGVIDLGIQTRRNRWTEPAIGRCDCGARVYLDSFTNTCERCGTDYNSSGQRLAPRDQWGEETGETLADILSIR